jgi:hypothetical protein
MTTPKTSEDTHSPKQAKPKPRNGVYRRTLVRTAGGVLIYQALDLESGALKADSLRSTPQVFVWPNPNSNNVLVAAPGAGNSGYHMGRLLQRAVGNMATIVGVDYAENNVNPAPITSAVKDALAQVEVPNRSKMRLGHYWLSIGGVVMAPVVHELGEQADLALLDSTPLKRSDLRGINGVAAGAPHWMEYIRWLNWMFVQNKDNSIPNATQDHAEGVPDDLAIAHRDFTVHADLLTTGPEVRALNRSILPNALAGFAANAYFMTAPSGEDPLVITEMAHPSWNSVLGGNLELYLDPHRASSSHGIGPIYPGGIRHQMEQHLA